MKNNALEMILQEFDAKKDYESEALENGIVWFNGVESYDYKKIGVPEDYIKIRDNYHELKTFLGQILDKGRVYYGIQCRDQDGETNCAKYAIWLYKHSKNGLFKNNFEKATIELLIAELKREFKPFDYKSGMEGALKRPSDKKYYDENLTLHTARWRNGISEIDDESEGWFRNWFDEELGKTLRTDKREGEIIPLRKASPGFKEALKRRFLHREAYNIALKGFTPQFNRLVGLLDIIIELGNYDNGFSRLYEEWNDEYEVRRLFGLFGNCKTLKYYSSSVNIRQHLRQALDKINYFEKYSLSLKKRRKANKK